MSLPTGGVPLRLRWSARSEVGLVRDGNEDSGYAGVRLLAVADGMGGMVAGDVASNLTVDVLRQLDDAVADDVVAALRAAVNGANERLRVAVQADPSLEGMGTTVTALLWDGKILGLAHIGDSRGYLLRDGRLERLTHDHTFVQSLVDDGRITEAEARVHPHRSLLLRALDGRAEVDLDVARLELVDGDRFLLCSDGLCGYVDDEAIAGALARAGRDDAVNALVELAMLAGGVDNVTCLVADAVEEGSPSDDLGDHGLAGTVEASAGPVPAGTPAAGPAGPELVAAGAADGAAADGAAAGGRAAEGATARALGRHGEVAVLIGAAAMEPAISEEVAAALARAAVLPPRDARTGRPRSGTPRRHGHRGRVATDPLAADDPEDADDPGPAGPGAGRTVSADPEEIRYALLDPRRSRWVGRILVIVVALVIVLVGAQQSWAWSQRQYYVGARDGHVAIYRGIPESLLGISLSSVHSTDSALPVAALPPYYQQRVTSSLSAGTLENAQDVVLMLEAIADHCRLVTSDQQCRGDTPLLTTPTATAPASGPSPTGTHPATSAAPTTRPPTATVTVRPSPVRAPTVRRSRPPSRRPSPRPGAAAAAATGAAR